MAAIVASVVTAIFSVLATALLGYWRIGRPHNQLAYEVLSAGLIIPKISQRKKNIRVTVDPQRLGREDGDNPSKPVDVEEVYGFRIAIRNVGNEDLREYPKARIRLDDSARIINVEAEDPPDFDGKWLRRRIDENEVTVEIPFLNRGKQAIVSIQSVFNESAECLPFPGRRGASGMLDPYDLRFRRNALSLVSVIGGALALLGGQALVTVAFVQWDAQNPFSWLLGGPGFALIVLGFIATC